MQALKPDQANFLLQGVYLPALKNEHGITKKVMEAIPSDKGDYRPDSVSRSALDLAWHIAAAEMRFIDAVCQGRFDFSPNPLPDTVKNPADLVAWYEKNFAQHLEKASRLSSDELLRTVEFRGIFQLPAVMYLGFILHHTIHHRGQLSTYLRPMGAKVPSIYGESYDAAEARKAAQA